MADLPNRPGLRHRISARMFGGASGGVFRGMATLALGSGAGRLIGIASIPVLTRLYTPEDFGVLAVFTAFVQLLIPLATLRYLVALPLPRSDRVAFALMALCVGLAVAFSLATAGVLYAMGETLFGWFGMAQLAPYWWLLAVGMLGASLYETLTMWATRKRAYGVIARTQVVQSAFGEGLKILLGLLAVKPLGLLLGQVTGHSGGLGRLLSTFRADYRRLGQGLRWQHVRLVARRYRGFPVYRLPAQFLLVFSMQAPLLFAAWLYDAETTGQLGLAMMAILLPMNILGVAIARVFYSEAANGMRSKSDLNTMIRASLALLLLVGMVSLPLSLSSEALFMIVFGQDWTLAGVLCSILLLQVPFQIAAAPFAEILSFSKSQSNFLLLMALRVALLIAGFIFITEYDASVQALAFLISSLASLHYTAQSIVGYFSVAKEWGR